MVFYFHGGHVAATAACLVGCVGGVLDQLVFVGRYFHARWRGVHGAVGECFGGAAKDDEGVGFGDEVYELRQRRLARFVDRYANASVSGLEVP